MSIVLSGACALFCRLEPPQPSLLGESRFDLSSFNPEDDVERLDFDATGMDLGTPFSPHRTVDTGKFVFIFQGFYNLQEALRRQKYRFVQFDQHVFQCCLCADRSPNKCTGSQSVFIIGRQGVIYVLQSIKAGFARTSKNLSKD